MTEYEKLKIAVFLDRAQYKFNRVPQYMYDLQANPFDLLGALCEGDYLNQLSEKEYHLTQKGSGFLAKHRDYVEYYHDTHKDFSFNEYLEAKRMLPFKGSYSDVRWHIYSQRQLKYWKSGDAARLAANYHSFFQILYKEKKYSQAYQQLLFSVYCSLAELDNANHYRQYPVADEEWIAPASGIFFHDYREHFDASMIDLCETIPLKNPPSIYRFKKLISTFVNK